MITDDGSPAVGNGDGGIEGGVYLGQPGRGGELRVRRVFCFCSKPRPGRSDPKCL
jgi:hypothetical protein